MPRLLIFAALLATYLATPPLTDCACSSSSLELFSLPSNASGAPPLQIRSIANSSQCWSFAKSVGGVTCDGVCIFLGDCSDPSIAMTWRWDRNGTWLRAASPPSIAGWCADENLGAHYLQAYPSCNEGDTHQLWQQDGSPGKVHELWSGSNFCMAQPGSGLSCNLPPPPPPPKPRSAYCPTYHPIQAEGIYDPSGPLLDDAGWWHMWEDTGGWSHYISRDLLHWDSASASTGFGGLTGSVAVTPSGTYAFFPEGSQAGIDMAPSTDPANLTTWGKGGRVIAAPQMAGGNFRDPLRAFHWPGDGNWYVGVGCNNQSKTADLCLFQAADDSLAQFTFVGSMFTAEKTLGRMVNGGVWKNDSVQATMMECPDAFALGNSGKWMVIGSLYSTNQWWIGTMAGSPPRFTPLSVGIMDYGYGYAAKTGSTIRSLPMDRRVVFGFTGWTEPTAATGCGRALIIPRDITLGPDGSTPRITPIPELQSLRVPGTAVNLPFFGAAPAQLTPGSAVWVSAMCTFPPAAVPTNGAVFARVLATSDGGEYTEVGVDFSGAVGGWGFPTLYANHSSCCGGSDGMVQTAPLVTPALLKGMLNLTILVDGGLIEVFLNGLVALTALVNPTNSSPPSARGNTLASTVAAAACTGASWAMASVPAPAPPPPPPPPPIDTWSYHFTPPCMRASGGAPHDIAAAVRIADTTHVWPGCWGNGGDWVHTWSTDLVHWSLGNFANIGASGAVGVDETGAVFAVTGGLSVAASASPSLEAWGPPVHLFSSDWQHGPGDPPRPWRTADGTWRAATCGVNCVGTAAAYPCPEGGLVDLWASASDTFQGPNASWARAPAPLWASNETLFIDVQGQREPVTIDVVTHLPGDEGGEVIVLLNNQYGPPMCACLLTLF